MVNGKKRKSISSSSSKPKQLKTDGTNPLFNFASPQATLESLIHPTSSQDFFDNYWEKKPLIVSRNGDLSAEQISGLETIFSASLFEKATEYLRLGFGKDLHVCRFDGKKTINISEKGFLTVPKLKKFLAEKCTFQVHQPQKYSDLLWHILENFETLFGCLVGCNVYITPPGTQGLAPHYDDVEVMILQLEGEKHWRLYSPKVELARDYVANLNPDELGEPIADFTLKPGDFLYFPRGTVHQAFANEGDKCSTHITISTYQHHSHGDYLRNTIFSSIEDMLKTSIGFRKGLPIGSLSKLNSEDDSKNTETISNLKTIMGQLTESVVKLPPPEQMLLDFWASRLPPFGVSAESLKDSQPDSAMPSLSSKVRLLHKDHVCFFPRLITEEQDDDEDDQSDGENRSTEAKQPDVTSEVLFFCSSLMNSRLEHMVLSTGDEEEKEPGVRLRFPLHFNESLRKLQKEDVVEVSSLALTDEEKMNLLNSIWCSHLLQVLES